MWGSKISGRGCISQSLYQNRLLDYCGTLCCLQLLNLNISILEKESSEQSETGKGKRWRTEIIEEARRFFSMKPFEQVSTEEIIRNLRIAKGTLYHHFRSKEEILEAVVEGMVDEDLEKKVALLESDGCAELSAIEKLELLLGMNSLADENG